MLGVFGGRGGLARRLTLPEELSTRRCGFSGPASHTKSGSSSRNSAAHSQVLYTARGRLSTPVFIHKEPVHSPLCLSSRLLSSSLLPSPSLPRPLLSSTRLSSAFLSSPLLPSPLLSPAVSLSDRNCAGFNFAIKPSSVGGKFPPKPGVSVPWLFVEFQTLVTRHAHERPDGRRQLLNETCVTIRTHVRHPRFEHCPTTYKKHANEDL